jgi:hypothetical protein
MGMPQRKCRLPSGKYHIAQRNYSTRKSEASNRINPLLVVIKTTRSEEVTGDVGGVAGDRPRRFSKFNIENGQNRHVSAAASLVSTAWQFQRLAR